MWILTLLCLTMVLMPWMTLQQGIKYSLYAHFNMGGVKGVVLFQQADNSAVTLIKVQMETFDSGPWSIHEYPFIYKQNSSKSCSDIGDVIEHGDLTQSHGEYGYKSSYVDPNLRLFGSKTLLGRSLAIYEKDGTTVRACGNILEFNASMIYAKAVIHGTISGQIALMRSVAHPDNPSIILGELFRVDGGKEPLDGLTWYVGEDGVHTYGKCSETGEVFGKPSKPGLCHSQMQSECSMGDLTGKHGTISAGLAGENKALRRRFRFVDTNIRIAPPLSIISKAVVIKFNNKTLGCGDFVYGGPMMYEATFDSVKHSGVGGRILFRQSTPYHAVKITVQLEGLHYHADAYHIHEFPIPSPEPQSDPCGASHVGLHLNPRGIDSKAYSYPLPGAGTADKYEAGDLSGKFGPLVGKDSFSANFSDHQISLFGRYNILGRAIVIHENDGVNSRWVCTNILPKDAVKLSAFANFTETSELEGGISLEQYIQSNGVLTDTAITVAIKYQDGPTKTFDHNWHAHTDPVGSDSKAELANRCASVKAHYNPYNVSTTEEYGQECSEDYHLRCELGDLSSRLGKYVVGGGKRYFVDQDFTLIGGTTAIGRSFTMHEENGGHGRLACATISSPENNAKPAIIGPASHSQ